MKNQKNRERLVFESLLDPGESTIDLERLPAELEKAGLRLDDPRLTQCVENIEASRRFEPADNRVSYERFVQLVGPSILTVERALKGEMVIPDFDSFGSEIERIFRTAESNHGGEVAGYIPQLGRVSPDKYGVSLCTVDGQRLSLGDTDEPFSAQCTVKPVNYALALEEHGDSVVHDLIGCEPSGRSFNELTLNGEGRPHNPMLNSGAILCGSLIRRDLSIADRFEYVQDVWQKLSGGTRPGFCNPIYLSERETADRNFALGYFMREKKAFPEDTDLLGTLEFWIQCCSLEVTAELVSVVAATLANGGICPLTGERIFRPDTVQKVLSMMYSCGMYDFSGEFAFRIGLPAKSGVSGVLMAVVPNVMGFCTWSPRLDQHGNSVRGIEFCKELVSTFNFHNYDNLVGGLHEKQDPRRDRHQQKRNLLVDLCWAASEGDVDGIRRLRVQGADLDAADYDGRTALHLAASEGRARVVAYLIRRGVNPAPVDRWGNTPLDDARRGGFTEVERLLSTDSGTVRGDSEKEEMRRAG